MNKILCLFLCFSLLFSGCGTNNGSSDSESSNSESSGSSESADEVAKSPVENTESKYAVNWDKCIEDYKLAVTNPEHYDYVNEVYVKVNENDKQITLSAILDDDTDPTVALDYAGVMIRQFNHYANMQDGSIALDNEASYGGLYDTYKAMIGIAPQNQAQNSEGWFVFDAIPEGSHLKHELKLQSAYQS